MFDPQQGYSNSAQLVGLKLPAGFGQLQTGFGLAPVDLVEHINITMPLMLSSLKHDHMSGNLFGVAWDKELRSHRLVEIDPKSQPEPEPAAAVAANSFGLGDRARGDYDTLSPWLFTSALDHERPLYYQMLQNTSAPDTAQSTQKLAGTTVLRETNSTSGQDIFTKQMEPGFVDIFVLPAPSIARLEPKTGPFEGGTTVTIKGDYMAKTAKIGCQFDYKQGTAFPGDKGTTLMYQGQLEVDWEKDAYPWSRDLIGLNSSSEVNATFSEYDVICTSPRRADWFKLPENGYYSKLNVTRDTIDFRVGIVTQEWSLPVHFEFYRQPIIAYVVPRFGPLTGNTTVTLFGSYFYDTGTILCSFGSLRGIRGTFDNLTNTITCITPNQTTVGTVSVEVALNGQQYTHDSVKFTYYQPADAVTISLPGPNVRQCTGICPRSGPTTGGTRVVVSGQNFLETNETKCKFGTIEMPATFLRSSNQIVCLAPRCCYDDQLSTYIGTKVNFEIALNGQQYTTSGFANANFQFYLPPTVASISPLLGNFNQEVITTVNGNNVVETNEIKCRFGHDSLVVDGTRKGFNQAVECTSPKSPLAGPVQVSLALNGQQFTTTTIGFSYIPVLYRVAPNKGPIEGNTNVSVYGLGFPVTFSADQLKCRFAHGSDAPGSNTGGGWSEVVPAVVASNSAVFCQSPPLNETEAGSYKTFQIEVSVDGGNFFSISSSAVKITLPVGYPHFFLGVPNVASDDDTPGLNNVATTFLYYTAPQVTEISPVTGVLQGNTLVTITGVNFIDARALLKCRFTHPQGSSAPYSVVDATFASATRMTCLSPNVVNSGSSHDADVHITQNDQQYTSNHDKFTYYDAARPPTVNKIEPGSGSKGGRTRVKITGSNFKHAQGATVPPLKCRFGSNAQVSKQGLQPFLDTYLAFAPATFISSTQVECMTPGVNSQASSGTIPKTIEVANEPKGFNQMPLAQQIPKNSDGSVVTNYWLLEQYALGNYMSDTKYEYSTNQEIFLYSSTSARLSRLLDEPNDGPIKNGFLEAGAAGIVMIQAYNEENTKQTTGNDIFYLDGELKEPATAAELQAQRENLLLSRGIDTTGMTVAEKKRVNTEVVLELVQLQLEARGPHILAETLWGKLKAAIPAGVGSLPATPTKAQTDTVSKAMSLLQQAMSNLDLTAIERLPVAAATFSGSVLDLDKILDAQGNNQGGKYQGNFTAFVAGEYELKVQTAGKTINAGQPSPVRITYADPYPAAWTVRGPGLGSVVAAEIKDFYIQMRDQYSNPIECCSRSTTGSQLCYNHLKEACIGAAGTAYAGKGHDVTYNSAVAPRLHVSIINAAANVDVDLRCKRSANCGNEVVYASDCSDPNKFKQLYDLRARRSTQPFQDQGPCGAFKVKYSTWIAGSYQVKIAVRGPNPTDPLVQVKGSPFTVIVQPEGTTDTVSSVAYGDGLTNTFAGEVSHFYVQAKDKYSNNRLVNGDEFVVRFAYGTGDSTVKITTLEPNIGCPAANQDPLLWTRGQETVVTNCDLKNSTYLFSYIAVVTGEYSVSIMRAAPNLEHIKGSPFKMNCYPSMPNVSRTTSGELEVADALGTWVDVTAGVPYNFTIQARDSYNNKRITGGDIIHANAWYLGESRVVPKAKLHASGRYACTDASHTHAGQYVWHEGNQTCAAPERWLEYTGQSRRAVLLNTVIPALDENDGRYKIIMIRTVTGYYDLDVYMLPQTMRYTSGAMSLQVPASPFTIRVEPAPASAIKSFVFGDGLKSTDATQNITTVDDPQEVRNLTIVGVDQYGNLRRKGSDPFGASVLIKPFQSFGSSSNGQPFTIAAEVRDSNIFGKGRYTVTYKPTVAGVYGIAVFLGPAMGTLPVAQMSWWRAGAGFPRSQAEDVVGGMCVQNCFTPLCRNALGLTVTCPANQAPAPGLFEFSDQRQNATAGFVASVTLLPTQIAATQCVASGTGLGVVTAGSLAGFRIQARDRWGNDRTLGGDTFTARVLTNKIHQICDAWLNGVVGGVCSSARQGKIMLNGIVADNVDSGMGGTYDVTYNATVSGGYQLVVELRVGSSMAGIGGSPFAPTVLSANTHAQSCTVRAISAKTKAGSTTSFIIEARDQFGNKREGSQHAVHATQKEGAKITTILTNLPPAVPATIKLLYWDRFTDTTAPAGSDCSFEPPLFNPPNGDRTCDTGKGEYLAVYKPTVAGRYQITLTYGGVEFSSSPKFTTVVSADLNIDGHVNSVAYGEGLYRGVSRKPAVFTIQARDRFNNNVTEGGALFTVSISGKEYIYDCNDDASKAFQRQCTQIVDLQTGFYSVTWYPTVVGDYKIRVRLQISATVQNDIKGSMTNNDCKVDPDKTSPGKTTPCGVAVGVTRQCRSAAEIKGLAGGIAGQTVTYTIQARDAADNPQPSPGGDQFTVSLACTQNCRNPGYVLILNPCQPVMDPTKSPFPIYPATACSNCVCDVLVVQTSAAGVPYKTGTGQYRVTYASTVAGTYSMGIALTRLAPSQGQAGAFANDPIGNLTQSPSPYTVTIAPAAYHAPQCIAFGTGTSTAVAGNTASMTIQPKDKFGNNGTIAQKLAYTSPFKVKVFQTTASPLPGQLLITKDAYSFLHPVYDAKPNLVSTDKASVYTVSYKISVAGLYRFKITLVDPDPATVASTVGPADFTGAIQNRKDFVVQVYPAAAAQPRTRVASATLPGRFCLQGLENQRVVDPNADAAAAAAAAQADPCPTQLAAAPVPAWLYMQEDPPGCVAAKTQPCKHNTIRLVDHVRAGSTANFTVFLYDIHDNSRRGSIDKVTAELRAKSAAGGITAELFVVACKVTDQQDGSYSLEFQALRSAEYDVQLKINGLDVRDPPFKAIVVASERDPAQCGTEGAGVVGGQHNKQLVFTIIVRDRYKNRLDRPTNDTFIVEMYGLLDGATPKNSIADVAVPVNVINEGPSQLGLYTVSYAAPDLTKANNGGYPFRPLGPWTYALSVFVPGDEQQLLTNQRLSDPLIGWSIQDSQNPARVNIAGRTQVLKLTGTSGYSHLWQTFDTVPGQKYRVRSDLFLDPAVVDSMQVGADAMKCLAPTVHADNTACVANAVQAAAAGQTGSTGTCGCWGNGGVDVVDALACGGVYNGGNVSAGVCNYRHSTVAFVPPDKDEHLQVIKMGKWVPVMLTFVAPSRRTTVRLHFSDVGAYFDNVTVDTHIKGSPFTVTTIPTFKNSVARNPASGKLGTTAAGNGLSGSVAGIEASFAITPRNPVGLRQDPSVIGWQADYFLVQFDGQAPLNFPAPTEGGREDRSFVKYMQTVAGTYNMSIKLETPGATQDCLLYGCHIEQSPFVVTIVSGAAVPEKTRVPAFDLIKASGSTVQAIAGVPAPFVIQTMDKFGNLETDLPVVGIGDKVSASLKHKTESALQPLVAGLERTANGTVHYTATYTGTFAGKYDLSITLNNKVIGDGQPVEVTLKPAPTHPVSCVVSGLGVRGGIAGKPGNVELFVKDRFGNLVSDEVADFQLRMYCVSGKCVGSNNVNVGAVVGITSIALGINDMFTRDTSQGNGYYRGQYYLTVAGKYQLSVELQGVGLVGAQQKLPLTISPTNFDHDASRATGSGLIEGRAGRKAVFKIFAMDKFDNQQTAGGLVFSVQLRGPSFILGSVTDEADGTYSVSFEPKIRGDYQLQVRSRGKQIPCRSTIPCHNSLNCNCHKDDKGVPTGDWSFRCTPASTFADKTYAYGPGLSLAVADKKDYEFKIRAMDKFSVEQAAGGESSQFKLAIKDVATPALNRFQCNAKALRNDPFPGAYSWNPAKGLCYETIYNKTLDATADKGDGSYDAKYQVKRAGTFMLHVTYSNHTADNTESCALEQFTSDRCGPYDILGSPFELTVEAGPVSPKDCVVVGFDQLQVQAGKQVPFVIQTKDEFSNNGKYDPFGETLTVYALMEPCTSVGATCAAKYKGCCPLSAVARASANLKAFNLNVNLDLAKKDGTYKATILATISHEYIITVRVGGPQGTEIHGSPYRKKVLPGESSVQDMHVTVPAAIIAGRNATIIARTRDANRNWLVSGGEQIRVTMRTTVGSGMQSRSLTYVVDTNFSTISDLGNGTYFADILLTVAGTYDLQVTSQQQKAFNSVVKVNPAESTDGESSVASGPGWNGVYWKRQGSFEVQARDRFGNVRATAGDRFLAEFAEVTYLNTTGSLVLVTEATGVGRNVHVIRTGSGTNALKLFGTPSVLSGSEGESGVFTSSLITPHDFTAVSEKFTVEVNGVPKDYTLNLNVKDASDLAKFFNERFAAFSVAAQAVACPDKCDPFCRYCSEHGKRVVYPSDWSKQTMKSIDNSSQPLTSTYVGSGRYRFDYFANGTTYQDPKREVLLIVYHCHNFQDPNCDLRSNISDIPRQLMITASDPDPSPVTSGMIGTLGGKAGSSVTFTLQTRNPHGVNEISGGANITFIADWLVPPPPPEIDNINIVDVDQGVGTYTGVDQRNGLYSMTAHTFTVAAYYTLVVKLTSLHGKTVWDEKCDTPGCSVVKGSPFEILITPAELDLKQTKAAGPGTLDGVIDPNLISKLTITPYDRYGNRYVPSVVYAEATHGFAVTVQGPALSDGSIYTVLGTLVDKCERSTDSSPITGFGCVAAPGQVKKFAVEASYHVTLSGSYRVFVTYGKQPIDNGAPIGLQFEPGAPQARHSFVSGSALSGGPAGSVLNFTCSMHDYYGNIVSYGMWASTQSTSQAIMSGASAFRPQVFTIPGVVGTGFDVQRIEKVDVRTEELVTPTVSTRTTITTTTVAIVTPTMVRGQKTNATVTSNGDGTFTVGYVQYVAGSYNISVLVGDQNLQGSPYVSQITSADLFTPDCEATGPGLVTARAGKAASFMIFSKDPYGNDMTVGGNSFTVTLQGPVYLRASVSDCGLPPSLKEPKAGCLTQYCVSIGQKDKDCAVKNGEECCVSVEQCVAENCLSTLGGTYFVEYQPMTSGRYGIHITRSEVGATGATQTVHTKGSPYAMEVKPGNTFAGSCDAFGTGLTSAVAGVQRGFTIQARDQLGAMLRTGGDSFEVQLTSDSLTVPANVVDNVDGSYSVGYRMTKSGSYNIRVLLGIEGINGSPFKLTVLPAATNAEQCVASGGGLTGMIAGDKSGGKFTIQARDRYANQRTSGGDVFNALLSGRTNGLVTAGTRTDNNDGTYAVSYILTIIGTYDLRILFDRLRVGGGTDIGRPESQVVDMANYQVKAGASPFVTTCTASTTDFDRTLVNNIPGRLATSAPVTSETTTQGLGGKFSITAKDTFGNKKESSEPEYAVVPFKASLSTMFKPTCHSLSSKTCTGGLVLHTVSADVQPKASDGTFEAKFATTLAGEYDISVTYGLGFPIFVQFKAWVRPGAVSVQHSYPFGTGLEGGLINTNVTFGIQTVDKWGNLIFRKIDRPFRVDIDQTASDGSTTKYSSTTDPSHASVQPNVAGADRDYETIAGYGQICGEGQTCDFTGADCHVCGTYTVRLNVPLVGIWRLIIISRGETLATAPGLDMATGFLLRFEDSAVYDQLSGDHSEAVGLHNGIVGKDNKFTVVAKTRPSEAGKDDALDWPKGQYQVKVEVVPVSKLMAQVSSFGAYTVELCSGDRRPDQYVWTTANDNWAGGSRGADVLNDPGYKSAPKNFVSDTQTVDNDDGTVTVTWRSDTTGEHRIVVLIVDDGNAMGQGFQFPFRTSKCIKNSPFIVNVTSGRIDGALSQASGSGLGSGSAGEELSFTITTSDTFGNVRTYNSDQANVERGWTVLLKPNPPNPQIADALGVVTDQLDGTFEAEYQSTFAGSYEVHVLYGSSPGVPIRGSPWPVTIQAGKVSTQKCTASNDATQVPPWGGLGSAVAGITAQFKIKAKDQYGNVAVKADKEIFVTSFSYQAASSNAGTPPIVPSAVVYGGSGEYDVAYNATRAGVYMLQITRESQTIDSARGSAFYSVTVQAGVTSPGRCTASGLGLSGGTAGEVQSFKLEAKDAYDNPITKGGDKFVVKAVLVNRKGIGIVNDIPDDGSVKDNANGQYDASYKSIFDGTYELRVTLNGQPIFTSPFTGVILIMAKPPALLSATFGNTGGSIDVVFDVPTNKAKMVDRGPCDAVMDATATLKYLGNGPLCFWGTPSVLTIFMGNGFLIDRGFGKIRLKKAALQTILENSEDAVGEVGPEFPPNPPIPQIQIRVPTSVGLCEDVILDASGSTGTGGRPLKFRWGVQVGSSNASLIQSMSNDGRFHDFIKLPGMCDPPRGEFTIPCQTCQNQRTGDPNPMTLDDCKSWCARNLDCRGFLYRASGSGHCVPKRVGCADPIESVGSSAYFYHELVDSRLHIPFNYFGAGETYTFVLKAENWMQQASTWSGSVDKKSIAIPAITMMTGGSPSFPMEFTSSSEVDISAAVNVPVCIDSAAFEYKWTLLPTPSMRGKNLDILDARTSKSLSLFVPKLTFEAGAEYQLQLHAHVAGKPAQSNKAIAYVRVVYSDLVAVIAGGDRAVAATTPLTIDASASYDPDQSKSPFEYKWTCTVGAAASPCFDHLCMMQAPCSTSTSPITQGMMSKIMFTTTQKALTIPAGALLPDQVYEFGVEVQKESRVPGSAKIQISSVAGKPPIVTIDAPANPTLADYTGKVNPSERLILAGTVELRDANDQPVGIDVSNSVWSMSPLPADPLMVEQPTGGTNFIVAKDTLTPGSTYTFRLQHNVGGVIGYAQFKLLVNRKPFGGVFKVSPKLGDEFTKFTLSASDWVDDQEDLPFIYEYRQYPHDAPLKSLQVIAKKAVNKHTTILPKGRVTVYCYVQDQFGAAVENSRNLTISPCVSDCMKMNELSSLSSSGDSDAATAMMAALAGQMGGDPASGRRRLQTNASCDQTCQSVLKSLKATVGDEVTANTPFWQVIVDKRQEATLRRRLAENLPSAMELPTQLIRRLSDEDMGVDSNAQQFNSATLAAFLMDAQRLATFIGVTEMIYSGSNPSKERISSLASMVASVVQNPGVLVGTVLNSTVAMYSTLVTQTLTKGLDDAAAQALSRIGSKLLQAANELLPPLSSLASLEGANMSDSSIFSTYSVQAKLVEQVSVRLEAILGVLSESQLSSRIAGETEIVAAEENFVMQSRRVLKDDIALTSKLATVGQMDNFFQLPPSKLLEQIDNCMLSAGVSYRMIHYKGMNPFLVRAKSTSARSYLSTVSSLAILGTDCSSGKTATLPIVQLLNPIVVGISAPNAQQYYHDPTKQANCKWFDEADNTWKLSGCQVIAVTNTTLNCSCTHLTNFAAFLEDSFTDIVPESRNEFDDAYSMADPGSIVTMLATGSLFLSYLVAVVWGYRRDVHVRRKEKRSRLQRHRSSRSSSGRTDKTLGSGRSITTGGSRGGGLAPSGGLSSIGGASGGTGSTMLRAQDRRVTWGPAFKRRLQARHLCRSFFSKLSMPFFSRAQQATVMLTATLIAHFLCAFFLYVPPKSGTNTTQMKSTFDLQKAFGVGCLSAVLAFPVINILTYLFVLCGTLKRSVLESQKYGKKKWRPTAVYALLWLSSVLYSFSVAVCVSCSFLVLLYGTKMDHNQAITWLVACLISMAFESLVIRHAFCALETAWSMRKAPVSATALTKGSPTASRSASMSSVQRQLSR